MADTDNTIGDGIRGEEELLDFEFDDLPDTGLEKKIGVSKPEEEILDLVDIAGPGKIAEDLEPDETKEVAGEDEGTPNGPDEELDPEISAALEGLESNDIDMFESEDTGEKSEADEIASLLDLEEDGEDKGMEQFEGIPEEDASNIFDLDSAFNDASALEADSEKTGEELPDDSELDDVESLFEDEDIAGDEAESVDQVPEIDTDLEELDLSDEDVLEMEPDEATETDDIGDLMSEEDTLEEFDLIEEEPDTGLEEIEPTVDEDATQVIEPELEAFVEEKDLSEDDFKAEVAEITEADEMASLLDEDEIFDEQEGLEEGDDLGLDELDKFLQEDATQTVYSDLDATVKGMKPDEEADSGVGLKESDLVEAYDKATPEVSPEPPEEFFQEEEKGAVETEGGGLEDLDTGTVPEIPKEDFSESQEAEPVFEPLEGDVAYPAGGESGAISEERIEAIVTKVAEDVLEKVARETMEKVAEKVIAKAIEALKGSLESPKI